MCSIEFMLLLVIALSLNLQLQRQVALAVLTQQALSHHACPYKAPEVPMRVVATAWLRARGPGHQCSQPLHQVKVGHRSSAVASRSLRVFPAR